MSWLSQTPHARSIAHSTIAALLDKKRYEIRTELLFHPDDNRKRFVCESDVRQLWHRADLVELFPRWSSGDIDRLRQLYIVSFTILVYIGWPIDRDGLRSIFLCKDTHVDANLPFSRDHLTGLADQYVELFVISQYIFKPCIIRKSTRARIDWMDPNRPWPFVDEPKKVGCGGYGEVWQAKIAKGCYTNESDQDNMISLNEKVVAYKHFSDGRNYQREVQSLDYLRESLINHDHIAVHLAAIVHGKNDFFIFFELTPLGDLEVLLNGGAEPDLNDSVARGTPKYDFNKAFPQVRKVNFVEELGNIASALEFLHENLPRTTTLGIYCAHFDLRPKNVLVYPRNTGSPNVGKWVLADFGISSFKHREPGEKAFNFRTIGDLAQNAQNDTTDVTGPHNLSGTHRAPELHELSNIKRYPGRKCDIWSLGCIANEVLAFLLGGLGDNGVESAARSLRDFRQYKKQAYYDDYWFEHETPARSMSKAKLRTSVINWLNRFPAAVASEQPEHAEWIGQFVELLHGILKIRPETRPLASDIVIGLKDIARNMEAISDSKPWASPPLGMSTDDSPSFGGHEAAQRSIQDLFSAQYDLGSPKQHVPLENLYGTSPNSIATSSMSALASPTGRPRSHEPDDLYSSPYSANFPTTPAITRLRSTSRTESHESTSPSRGSEDIYGSPHGSAGLRSSFAPRLGSTDQDIIPEIAVVSSGSEGSAPSIWSTSTGAQQAVTRTQSPSSSGRPSMNISPSSTPRQNWTFDAPANIEVFEIGPAGDKAAFIHKDGSERKISVLDLTKRGQTCQVLSYVEMPPDVAWDRLAVTSRYMIAAGKVRTQRSGVMLDLAEARQIQRPGGWPWPCSRMTPSLRGVFAWVDASHTIRMWNPQDNTEIARSIKQDIDHICFNATGTCLFVWAREHRTHFVYTINMLDPRSQPNCTRFEAKLARPANKTCLWPAQSDHSCLVQEGPTLARCYIRSDEKSLAPPQEINEYGPNPESSATALCDDWIVTAKVQGKFGNFGRRLHVSKRYINDKGQFSHTSSERVVSEIKLKGPFRLAAFENRHIDCVVVVTQSGGIWRFEEVPNALRQRHGSFLK